MLLVAPPTKYFCLLVSFQKQEIEWRSYAYGYVEHGHNGFLVGLTYFFVGVGLYG